jgi:hypothetical protein
VIWVPRSHRGARAVAGRVAIAGDIAGMMSVSALRCRGLPVDCALRHVLNVITDVASARTDSAMYVEPPMAFGVVQSQYKAVQGSNSAAENVMLLRVIAIMREPFGCDAPL